MCWNILESALKRTASRGSEQLVLVRLCLHASGKAGGECWPKIETICTHTGLSRSTVQRALRKLLAAGEISVTRPASKHFPATFRVDIGLDRGEAGQNDLPEIAVETGQNDTSRQVKMTRQTGQNDLSKERVKRTSKGTSQSARVGAREAGGEKSKKQTAISTLEAGRAKKPSRPFRIVEQSGLSPAECVDRFGWISEIGAGFGMMNGTITEQFEEWLSWTESVQGLRDKGVYTDLKAAWRRSCRGWQRLGAQQSHSGAATPSGLRYTSDGRMILEVCPDGTVTVSGKKHKLSEYVLSGAAAYRDTPDAYAAAIDLSKAGPDLRERITSWAKTVDGAELEVLCNA